MNAHHSDSHFVCLEGILKPAVTRSQEDRKLTKTTYQPTNSLLICKQIAKKKERSAGEKKNIRSGGEGRQEQTRLPALLPAVPRRFLRLVHILGGGGGKAVPRDPKPTLVEMGPPPLCTNTCMCLASCSHRARSRNNGNEWPGTRDHEVHPPPIVPLGGASSLPPPGSFFPLCPTLAVLYVHASRPAVCMYDNAAGEPDSLTTAYT